MRACGGQGLVWDSGLGLQLGAKTGNKSEKNCSKMSQTVDVRGGGGLPALQNDWWNGKAGTVWGWRWDMKPKEQRQKM